jgi:hypothetical protein
MSQTVEVRKTVPVVADVDVLVAGGGIAGSMAALAAARDGARTAIVERFGTLGGNMGPGMFSGGTLHLAIGLPMAMPQRLTGIPGEFVDRCGGYCDGRLGHDYFRDSQVVSYVWLRLMEENNVRLFLNTFAADPIMEGRRIVGLTVENKSGTQAIRAKVVIDATGDADVAFRAGAPTDTGETYNYPGMYFAVAGVDESEYRRHLAENAQPKPEDLRWAEETFTKEMGRLVVSLNHLIPFYKAAWEAGEYRIVQRIDDLATVTVDHGLYQPTNGIVGAQLGYRSRGEKPLLSGDAAMASRLEIGGRIYIFQTAQFLRRYVPGFANSYLHMISPYFHFRGGRSVVSEYRLTKDDVKQGARFDDVIFVHFGSEVGPADRCPEGNDFPYRQLLPREVDGLLATGRSAIIQPPTMRDRWKIMLMGQASGVAAAMAAEADASPRQIDVRELQRRLHHKYHAYMGDQSRLKELGII